MDILLLAEGITLDYKVLFSLGSVAVGIGGTIAVLKFRTAHNANEASSAKKKVEKESDKREEKDDKLGDKLDRLAGMMGDNTDMLRSKMAQSEKEQRTRDEMFQTKTFGKLDAIKDKQAEHDKAISIAETERAHIKDTLGHHQRKLTRMPSQDD